jgi:iron complex outermembrane receptor protein
MGYRYIKGKYDLVPTSYLNPDNEQLYNFFIQDEITLYNNTLWLTLGSKFEHNDYTQWEVQPNARLFWNINPQHKLWTAVSYAVRTPSRYEYNSTILVATFEPNSDRNDNALPLAYSIVTDDNFHSEEVLHYEIGYRLIPTQTLSIDMPLYYSEYNELQDFSYGNPNINSTIINIPIQLNNNSYAYASGFEIASHWQSSTQVNWDLSYNYSDQTLYSANTERLFSYSPHQNLSLRTNIEWHDTLEMNLWLKYTDQLKTIMNNKAIIIDDYATLDIRLAWQASKNFNISIIGQNLLESKHLEYLETTDSQPTNITRGVYLKLIWQY